MTGNVFSFFIARRLSFASEGKKAAPAVKVAVVAVALSVAVMLASIAIVKGFKDEITRKVVGFNAHLTLYAVASEDDSDEGSNLISLTPSLLKILDEEPYIVSYYGEAAVPAIFKTESDFKGIYYKGISESADTMFLHSNLVAGRMPALETKEGENHELAISQAAADKLRLKAGDTVDTYFISDDIRVRPLTVAGIFNSHFDNYDDVYVYGPVNLLPEVTPLKPQQATAMKVVTDDFSRVEEYTLRLQQRLNTALANGEIFRPVSVDNARNAGAQYFSWLALLDTNVVVILALMTVVACVTLIGGILIIILDKTRLIGLLKALGASNATVSKVFLLLSLRIAAVGMLFGNALMLGLICLQEATHIARLDPDAYYIDFVPTALSWWDVAWLNGAVLLVIMLVLWLPSRYVSHISPAATLRNE